METRDLVTGGAACAVPGSSSSSNPVGSLVGSILGSTSKLPEVRRLPGSTVRVPDGSSDYRPEAPLSTIPGSEYDNQQLQQPDAQSYEFLGGFHPAVHGDLADAWDEVHRRSTLPHVPWGESEPPFAVFEQIYGTGQNVHLQPAFDGVRLEAKLCSSMGKYGYWLRQSGTA